MANPRASRFSSNIVFGDASSEEKKHARTTSGHAMGEEHLKSTTSGLVPSPTVKGMFEHDSEGHANHEKPVGAPPASRARYSQQMLETR